ncbi:MAG: chromosomal replication initiator protein DnaA [Gammaproteobacteria bacterium]|nr:MAG: chromosomal replication initiator protein DnaA [Gammaproteobacteria bacterium]
MNNKDYVDIWNVSIERLKQKIGNQQFNSWIKPIKYQDCQNQCFEAVAPNKFVLNWVRRHYLEIIEDLLKQAGVDQATLKLSLDDEKTAPSNNERSPARKETVRGKDSSVQKNLHKTPANLSSKLTRPKKRTDKISREFTFNNFVEGKSNQLAKAAALQVAGNTGGAYNPFFIYGGVGLGKTHLMHAIGNHLLGQNPDIQVSYLHSEGFVEDMVNALRHNSMQRFKAYYRSVDILMIDDIQFFAGKERTQEEFFHTFNELLEGQKQVVLSCDRYPKEVHGLEDRLKSRFGWGLTVAIEPPELETRVAILKSKSEIKGIDLSDEVAFFIARRISSNVRELEGALTRVIAHSQLTGSAITVDFVKQALRDLLAMHDRQISIENIQKNVADYFNIRVSDLHSKSRIRSIARPRQMAMALAKELTNHSLPEIGQAFGGRDHTTVLHACKKIADLRESDNRLSDDYFKILRILTA